ncbi:ABC transporter ATP-binding protein [Corynebacterium tapiri]|uniref:ABC transporter ATP-binding protein n=1 Tax=Corynebacterium tapiri TaxID=1448266 RepID=A0A5C4U2L5_9CORY|nr:ABC transporter ATP-binding protein [Corynebacterium tapiri]TNL96831.1 ABC transporter ATP-binding protein [Corynebacterium tapiri]
MTKHLSFDHVTKSYGDTHVIADTSIDIAEGEFVCLLGPSGSGKSTLLNMIAGLDFPTTGEVQALGNTITGPDPERGLVFQDHALLPWKTARGNIEFGLRAARRLSAADRRTRALEYLRKVGLEHAADRRPSQLSGGMQQRVGLARAFAVDSRILLLDEPFGALDALTRRQLQALLLEVWSHTDSPRTVLMVTHDVDEAVLLADRILVMSHGPQAHLVEDLRVDIPRPRFSLSPENESHADQLRHHLLQLLEQEH